jgi:hypothetical protein
MPETHLDRTIAPVTKGLFWPFIFPGSQSSPQHMADWESVSLSSASVEASWKRCAPLFKKGGEFGRSWDNHSEGQMPHLFCGVGGMGSGPPKWSSRERV